MSNEKRGRWFAVGCLAACLAGRASAEERTERFDRDPGWEGRNNRSTHFEPRSVRQDFGHSRTAHAGGGVGEVGGFVCPAAEPAYYAKAIPRSTFDRPMSASGTIALDGRPVHALVGFFNAGTLNEWRTPNTIALRVSGRGDVFYAWLEYATSRWRAGGDDPRGFSTPDPGTGRATPIGFTAKGAVHRWSLRYDPEANGGGGSITATIDDRTAVCHLAEGHRADGATFDRFGLMTVMKSADSGGEVWLGDLAIDGVRQDLADDPGWEGFQNRRESTSTNVRPRFDFGFSPTQFAGGAGPGELGGLIFRGDCREPARMASYADRLDELTLRTPIQASGRVALRRGVTDSTTLLGFFDSRESMTVRDSQATMLPTNFLGVAIEGPSREGFYFAPALATRDGARLAGAGSPHIYPDGASHAWSLSYDPEGPGRITVRLDDRSVTLDVGEAAKADGARFDRFGLVTTWIDGNGQHVFFDDLTYTCRP
ncbi:hypothetical protein [Paludisphaera soli]|uniref:hypothetical protein n=1 Tax=Paludisphaera soli TaxID=2712865 RepID=UPI0013E9A023|nr:hypothetical protein [Paludisphaera soli]